MENRNASIKRNSPMTNFARLPRVAILMATLTLIAISGCGSDKDSTATSTPQRKNKASILVDASRDRTLTRLFWQDRSSGKVRVGDLKMTDGRLAIDEIEIKDFPDLSPQDNDLVQMAVSHDRLIVGVRDHEDGKKNSGWLEIKTGVDEEDHGDHSHWHYTTDVCVSSSILDTEQGNPAHVYRYGKYVYIANDKNNGFTQVNPADGSSMFFRGGGGHITMAAVNDRIAYSTWIDRDGDNKGRVDVVDLRKKKTDPTYSFNLDLGGIHGAGACGNRVYFAPANGISWVDCDFDFAKNSDSVDVHHLSLDATPEGTDYRTGAFESYRDHILCIAKSKSGPPALCVVNATAPNPKVTRVVCDDLPEGVKLSSVNATSIGKRRYAFAFAEGEEQDEKLLCFDLDPNMDRDFSDAKLVNEVAVGHSKLQGHFGHHGIAFVDGGKLAIVTNPGDGTVSVVDLVEQKVTQTIEVGGEPTHIANCGEST